MCGDSSRPPMRYALRIRFDGGAYTSKGPEKLPFWMYLSRRGRRAVTDSIRRETDSPRRPAGNVRFRRCLTGDSVPKEDRNAGRQALLEPDRAHRLSRRRARAQDLVPARPAILLFRRAARGVRGIARERVCGAALQSRDQGMLSLQLRS